MSEEKLILSICEFRHGGGSEAQIPLHHRALAAKGYSVSVVTRRLFSDHATQVTRKSLLRTLFLRGYFLSYLAKDHLVGALRSMLGIGRWLPYEQTHPYFYEYFSNQSAAQRIKHRLQIKLYSALADGLIVQTQSAKTAWHQKLPGFPEDKIFVLPNIVEIPKLQPSSSDPKFKIVMVGRLIDVKDYGLALAAIAELRKHHDFLVEIYGEGPLKESIAEKIKALCLTDTVFLKGLTLDKAEIYADKNLLLMTSRFEGMPNAIGEAMAFQLPIVSLDFNAGPRDFLGGADQHQLCLSRDPIQIAKHISWHIEEKESSVLLGIQNRSRVVSEFSQDSFAHKLSSIITSVPAPWKFDRFWAFSAMGFLLLGLIVGIKFASNDPPDTKTYLDFADNFWAEIFPTNGSGVNIFRTPGYPFLIVLVRTIAGMGRGWLQLANWLFNFMSIALIYFHCQQKSRKSPLSGVSFLSLASLFLLDPLIFYSSNTILSEAFFGFLVVLSLVCFFPFRSQPPGLSRLILGGIAMSSAILTRPSGLLLPIAIVFILLLNYSSTISPRKIVINLLLSLAVCYSGPSIWVARNYFASGIPSISSVGVFNLAHYRAAAIISKTENISFIEAQKKVDRDVGSEIRSPGDYDRTKSYAIEIISKHPLLAFRTMLFGSIMQIFDPGGIYPLQCFGLIMQGSGLLGRLATEGFSALIAYFRDQHVSVIAVLGWSCISSAIIYSILWYGLIQSFKNLRPRSIINDISSRERSWIAASLLVCLVMILVQAGPESTARFRIPLIPLFLSIGLLAKRSHQEGTH